jgi:hypothetical protein
VRVEEAGWGRGEGCCKQEPQAHTISAFSRRA